MNPTPLRSAAHTRLWHRLRIVVVDTETTGVTTTSRVVSVAMVELANGRFGNSSAWLINPGLKTIAQSQRHGLDAEALRDAPPFKAIAQEVVLRLSASRDERVVLAGFNASFDARMLQSELAAVGATLPPLEMLEIADLAAHVGVTFAPRSLAGLLAALDEHNPAAHTELGDAVATAKAALLLLEQLLKADDPQLEPVLVPLNPALLAASGRRRKDVPPPVLSEEHQAAHAQELQDIDRRNASLEVCLSERCEALAARIEDGIGSTSDAAEVVDWALDHALSSNLDRRTLGRLLAGLGRAAIRAESPELARLTLLDLAEPLQELGPCTPADRCGRCEHTEDTCRFDQVRQRLVQAFLLTSAELKPKRRLEHADAFLHMPRTSSRGNPRRGFYAELREVGEEDAAGYGAYLAANLRRRAGDRDWALRTLERAWTHGCYNPYLADAYASMLVLDRRTRTGSHFTQALEVCEAALALQGTRQARVWRGLAKRRERLAELAANPPQPKKRVPASQQRNRRPDPHRRFALE